MKAICQTLTQEFMAMFITEQNRISITIVQGRHLGAANGIKCLKFAKDHQNWIVKDCKKVMWSTDSKFFLHQCNERFSVRREMPETLVPSRIVPTSQTSGWNLMI